MPKTTACIGKKGSVKSTQKEKQSKAPRVDQEVELTRVEPVVLEVEQDGQTLSHLILFEIKARLNMTSAGMIMDGDIKETIYQMKEF